ncbi:MAG: ABC transporter substrate-binding protein, partial [Candidatus Rokuibacteriota bacterium]
MADSIPDKSRARKRGVSRRSFLKTLGVAGAASTAPAFLRSTADAQETLTPYRDPAAKRGGTLRYGVHTAPAHFDVHQSGTVANIGAQSPMYDTLIRRDPRDGQAIIPDLAFKWDVSPDGKKYTFHLRKGVKFHDGADFTAEDVKATYERIVRPPKGILIPRSSLFTAVSEIVVLDPHRI